MFDAKSLLEAMMRGAGPGGAPAASPQSAGAGLGGLGDILGQLMPKGAPSGAQGGGGLGDILGQLAAAAGGGQTAAPASHAAPAGAGGGLGDILGKLGGAGGAGGGLGDILGKLQQQSGVGGGSLMDVLGKVLAQATEGAKEGAGRIGDATGAREALGRAAGQVTGGASSDDVLAKLKDLINQNQLGAGAAMGGLGALVLGTHTGRSLAATAAKLGALALIGGLAYKAVQNYQSGKPLLTGAQALEAPPSGSGFEAQAVTQDQAALMIRAMIAAAASDGRIDAAEQAKIIGSMSQSGHLSDEARAFVQAELNNPASPRDLAASVETPEQAVQLYSAARFAIEPNDDSETTFLAQLAAALGLDTDLVAHIEATAKSATAAA